MSFLPRLRKEGIQAPTTSATVTNSRYRKNSNESRNWLIGNEAVGTHFVICKRRKPIILPNKKHKCNYCCAVNYRNKQVTEPIATLADLICQFIGIWVIKQRTPWQHSMLFLINSKRVRLYINCVNMELFTKFYSQPNADRESQKLVIYCRLKLGTKLKVD